MTELDSRARANRIRRATRQARGELNTLTEEEVKRLRGSFQRASQEIQQQIDARTARGRVELSDLRELKGRVEGVLTALSSGNAAQLSSAMSRAVQIGSSPFAGFVNASSLAGASDDALRFVQTYVAADGLQLSDRLWGNSRELRNTITQRLESAIIQGHSASQAALDLVNRGLVPPAELLSKAGQASAANLRRGVTELLEGKDAVLYRNALRLFRTELNRAHGEAYIRSAAQSEDAAGVRFVLSPNHPRPDICDLHARVNRYGLGPGVYPFDRHPWPAHPETLSSMEIVFKDELTAEDKGGKENRIEWLKRQPPSVQEGALGSRKKRAALLEGLLTEGQINTPWRILADRYAAQGVDVEALGKNLRNPTTDLEPAGALPHSAIASIDARLKASVQEAMDAITSVHGVGGLQKSVPVVANELDYPGMASVEGYHLTLNEQVREIGLTVGKNHQGFTFTHEFGHMLDYSGIGKRAQWASESDPVFAGVRSAMENSAAVGKLRARVGKLDRKTDEFLKYALSNKELWARAYSQWIALRSASFALMLGVDWWLKNSRVELQWQWNDFEPIATAIDDMMRRIGWLK